MERKFQNKVELVKIVDISAGGGKRVLLEEAVHLALKEGATDLHYIEGEHPCVRVNGEVLVLSAGRGKREEIEKRMPSGADPVRESDFTWHSDHHRARVHCYQKQERLALAIRFLPDRIPTPKELHLPPVLYQKVMFQTGLLLVTGPTGSGKTTTLASLIQELNRTEALHILTLEDPIEYLHASKKSLVIQREIGKDTESYVSGMLSALRQGPDVIMVGELRDTESIMAALHLAETGKRVMATFHAGNVEKAIYRIIDSFPADRQKWVRSQLAASLSAVVAQKMAGPTGRRMRPVFEVLLNHRSVAHLIRNGEIHQLPSVMQAHQASGMQTMEMELRKLQEEGIGSIE